MKKKFTIIIILNTNPMTTYIAHASFLDTPYHSSVIDLEKYHYASTDYEKVITKCFEWGEHYRKHSGSYTIVMNKSIDKKESSIIFTIDTLGYQRRTEGAYCTIWIQVVVPQ